MLDDLLQLQQTQIMILSVRHQMDAGDVNHDPLRASQATNDSRNARSLDTLSLNVLATVQVDKACTSTLLLDSLGTHENVTP